MVVNELDYKETNRYSQLILDYLDKNPKLDQFYNRFPDLSNFGDQINEKIKSLEGLETNRSILQKALVKQNSEIKLSKQTSDNIEDLVNKHTFTITTGHQLNLFTGPLYFFYKIISVINLCKLLSKHYPDYNFVPVYWMASEDHDFKEINYFNFQSKKISWDRNASGAVGELSLEGLNKILDVFSNLLPDSKNANELKQIFKAAYLNNKDLTQATRFLVNSIFGEDGLVIVDGNDSALKALFVSNVTDEVFNKSSFKLISKTNDAIKEKGEGKYKIQVNTREINLFYLRQNIRERIVEVDGVFKVLNTDFSWNKSDLTKEIESYPERFSPNSVLRPLYQEVVLPNLAYIGGGGELAYWLQLKSCFEYHKVAFPMLLMRNSVLLISQKQQQKIEKLGVNISDLFLSTDNFSKQVVHKNSDLELSFNKQISFLKDQFKNLYLLAQKTDASFINAVAAQEKKQIKGLVNLEKRLLKAQKRKLEDILKQSELIKQELFPNDKLQERLVNFSEFYLEYGLDFFKILKGNLDPLSHKFTIIKL